MNRKTDNLNGIFRETPEPPYYAVIFTSERTDVDDGYAETAQRMLELAAQQPGFLGIDSARDDALGITVSYWKDLASIDEWRRHSEHLEAQQRGREEWYRRYTLRIARVERSKKFDADNAT
ncbi:MAG TPA: antibiotic biosynthesis monooxygenase [Thiolapillus brandeum]|uniref:Antibiotic biosynthesis monooxygenase n=1 Tax=Thiolapillus brandeum TaxID=1076588 RepID=A0A831RX77_9GAMM|nr:antibiotic biosynthesis monooxygenase [Thiolapillus brandeum]